MSFGNMRRSAKQNSEFLDQTARGCVWFVAAIMIGLVLYALWTVL